MMHVAAAWAAITALALTLYGGPDSLPEADGIGWAASTVAESLIYLAGFAWLARRRPVMRLLEGLERPWRTGVLAFLAALVFGQLLYRSADTFPLVTWEMYGDGLHHDPRYTEFSGVMRDGEEVEINFAREFLALSRKVTNGLDRLAERIDSARDARTRAELERDYDVTLRSLARRYNEAHADAPVHALRAWRRTVPSDPFRGRETIRRELYREVSVQ